MRKAYCLIKRDPCYRRDGFMAGLKAAGFDARTGAPWGCEPGEVLMIWNRYGDYHDIASRFEQGGGTVLVAENGYVAPGGASPHDMDPRTIYALALDGHNGSGRWPAGGPERWRALDVELQAWQGNEGGHILVCPNRSFGRPDLIMPPDWAARVRKRLSAETGREIRLRPHPGNNPPAKPLAEDLAGAYACVIWSSSAGVHALIAGVTVICEGPRWICKHAALPFIGWVDKSLLDDYRFDELKRLAWAQWHIDEIATGAPIARLIEHARTREPAAA